MRGATATRPCALTHHFSESVVGTIQLELPYLNQQAIA
jgi:hypothetical protein